MLIGDKRGEERPWVRLACEKEKREKREKRNEGSMV
jgi:hypothetical protein